MAYKQSSTPQTKLLRILVADDHEMMRMAMRQALASIADEIRWSEAASAAETEAALADDLDLALIDFNMPGSGGTEWIARLRASRPLVPLIVVSGEESPQLVRHLIGCGVAGFIPKSDSAEVIRQAVRLVLSGGTYAPLRLLTPFPADAAPTGADTHGLTQRQLDVLRLLARGLPNKLIARELDLSEGTIKVHLLAIFRALNVRNRTEAVVAAQKKLQVPGPQGSEVPGAPRSL
jgi:DNA-binding NarL/FixJ family response regulator